MLVITRKTGEGIVIAEDISIKVLEAGKDRVRIGIDAPKDIKIMREEVYDTQKQNVAASGALPEGIIEQILSKKEE